MRTTTAIALTVALLPVLGAAAELQPKTLEAFDAYVASVATDVARRASGEAQFLALDERPADAMRVRGGETVINTSAEKDMVKVPGGLIHDWTGTVFVPGVTLDEALRLVQDYDSHQNHYRPEVIKSRLMERDGDRFHIYYRLLKKKVITVVLDTEHEVNYHRVDATRAYSKSYTTRVSEVKAAGKPGESALPDGQGGGYLWRLNSYWRFLERDGGVYVELRAISLTRGIPAGTGWIVKPIVREMPRISMSGTLTNTRAALLKGGAAAD